MKFIHEYDGNGMHRIVVIDGKDRSEGAWFNYQSIAFLGKYMCATQYYEGTFLPDFVYKHEAVTKAQID